MKVLFCSYADYGHLYPLMPLAEEMRDAGHDVTFATGLEFEPLLRGLGFGVERAVGSLAMAVAGYVEQVMDPVPVGGDRFAAIRAFGKRMEAMRRSGAEPDPDLIAKAGLLEDRLLRSSRLDLVRVVGAIKPDLVVYEDTLRGAAFAAAELDVPAVAVSVLLLGQVDNARRMVAASTRALWAEVGSGPLPGTRDLYLNSCPPGFGGPVPGTRVRPVPWSQPGSAFPQWIGDPRARPLVYVTMGTVAFADRERMRATLTGLAQLPVDVLVSAKDPDSLGELPSSIRVERFVRQDMVLRHVDVVVHHGGSGTTVGCLANGVPQVVMPWMADQFQNARAVADSGVGLWQEEVTPDGVAGAVRRLIDDTDVAATAAYFQQVVAGMPGPETVVADLENLA
jgi:UDP:flavonoid glycosyltransferase YjiC (YdhE family)